MDNRVAVGDFPSASMAEKRAQNVPDFAFGAILER
jgi:hypothetical protein